MKTNKGFVKKLGLTTLAALFAASIAACKPQQDQSGKDNTPAPATIAPISGNDVSKVTLPPNATPAPVHDLNGYDYRFIRIPYTETVNSMTPYVINSTEKLREMLTENSGSNAMSKTSLDDYLKQYDEEFFKSNYILVFNLTFSSGSVIPKVKSVKLENGTVTVVTEGTMEGDVGTSDMASYMCLLSLDNKKFPEASTFNVTGAGTTQSTASKRK
ncbi:MAG: hypothetical protein IKZ82_13645 [Clostridia bacterium]|nr:hypothetical protein [Clostridia bacterium]